MKQHHATHSILPVLLIAALSLALLACGGGNSDSSSGSGSNDTAVATSTKYVDYTLGEYSYSLPDYYKGPADTSSEELKYFYPEEENMPPLLMVQYSSLGDSIPESLVSEGLDQFQEGFLGIVDDGKITDTQDVTVDGLPGRTEKISGSLSGYDMDMAATFVLNTKDGTLFTVIIGQEQGSEKDYVADLDDIVSSIAVDESAAPLKEQDGSADATGTSDELGLGSTFEFDGFSITLGDSYSLATLNNQFSENNGASVIAVPATITNNNADTASLNMFYVKYFGSQGTELDSVFTYFDDSVEMLGELRPGASATGNFYMLYDGNGDYYISLDSWSQQVEVKIPVTQ